MSISHSGKSRRNAKRQILDTAVHSGQLSFRGEGWAFGGEWGEIKDGSGGAWAGSPMFRPRFSSPFLLTVYPLGMKSSARIAPEDVIHTGPVGLARSSSNTATNRTSEIGLHQSKIVLRWCSVRTTNSTPRSLPR